MYLYLYDAQLSAPRYRHRLARVETRLTDLGIGGKISRLSPLKNLRELLRDEHSGGVRTVIVVGTDRTFITVVNEAVHFPALTLGHIPLGKPTAIAAALGIPSAEAACATIAARRLLLLDLGRANNTYFLSAVTVPAPHVTLELDGRYQVKPTDPTVTVAICNLRPTAAGQRGSWFNPSDGVLEAFLVPVVAKLPWSRWRQPQPSILPCRQVKIFGGRSTTVLTDGERVLKPPVTVEVVPAKLRVIVGKERQF